MSNSFSSSLACVSPYISLEISTYTDVFFTSGRQLYSSIISCGTCLSVVIVYYGQSIGVLSKKFLTSSVVNFAFAVEMTLMKRHFIVVRSDVFVLTSSEQSILLPPTVILNSLGSSFWCL